MKVQNMTSRSGNKVANQFIIEDQNKTYFQSYNTTIVKKTILCDQTKPMLIELDPNWDYSTTTGKYRNQFLGETKKETEAKIKDGTYLIIDLNL